MTKKYTPVLNQMGFWEASPKPSEDELSNFYREKYYQADHGQYTASYGEDELAYFDDVARIAQASISSMSVARSLLDLGCGEGYFAKSFLQSGWDVACCDYSEFGIGQHNPELLPYFFAGDIYASIEHYKRQGRKFGLVNLQNVLEHVIDPVDLLKALHPILLPDSVVRIKVPNDFSDFQQALTDADLVSQTWFCPPEHLSYFNNVGLANLIEHCGFRMASLQATFPIELFLANPDSNYWKDRARGKGAHTARKFFDHFMVGKNVEGYIAYAEAAARIGFGRELVAYIRA